MTKDRFTISEFAEYTGVSVRTLHHYDNKKILIPERDKDNGHRIYRTNDLIQLHKVMTLKFLGLSLDRIREYMNQGTFNLDFIDTLNLQETKLMKDREEIDTALEVIHRTKHLLKNESEVDDTILVSLLTGMQHEKKQQELTKGLVKEDIADKMFPGDLKEKMKFERIMLKFYKNEKHCMARLLKIRKLKRC